MELRAHLSARDALYVEAWRNTLGGSQRVALGKWKTLASIYPDFFTAQSLFAYFSFQLANRFDDDVVAAAETAASRRNPHPLANELLLGSLYLSNEQYDHAKQKFVAVEQASRANHFACAFAYAALGQFDKADAALARGGESDASGAEIARYIPRIAMAFDRDQHDRALKLLMDAQRQAANDDPHYVLPYRGMELSLRTLIEPREKTAAALANYALATRQALAEASVFDRADAQFQVLFAAYLVARQGEVKDANSLLGDVGSEPASGDYPMLEKMLAVTQAAVLLAEGKADEAITRLKPSLDGSELYLTHATLMYAYKAKGELTSALSEARWLTAHRGRAYAEFNMRAMLMPLNVALSDIAQRDLEQPVSSN
jgi:tetratricopeptide (TPR) repeat protein